MIAKDLNIEIPLIIGNHPTLKPIADRYQVPFFYIPASSSNRKEDDILEKIKTQTDTLVLARYMQILSPHFLESYQKDIINIHHSFLPSFKGANPYRQAFNRGVKIIGATAHFATEDLDEGPIIYQNTCSVSHKDTVETLKRKGKLLEKQTLVMAIEAYSKHQVMKWKNKTIIFD